MPWDDLERSARAVDEVLPGVLTRGRHLRRRHRIAVRAVGSLAVVTCLIGVAAAAASTSGPGRHRVVAATGGPTTVAPPEETSTSTTAAPAPVASTTTVTAAPRRGTTTTTLYCHNSPDPRCGPFRWETDPGPNAPLTVEITYRPAHPRAGDTVTFFVTATDPDASQFPRMCSQFGDTQGACISGIRYGGGPDGDPYCGPMYGPWDPPRRPGQESLGNPSGSGVNHAYGNPGTYTVKFSFQSAATFCGYAGPYASDGSGIVQVTVDAAPSSTTTTTR